MNQPLQTVDLSFLQLSKFPLSLTTETITALTESNKTLFLGLSNGQIYSYAISTTESISLSHKSQKISKSKIQQILIFNNTKIVVLSSENVFVLNFKLDVLKFDLGLKKYLGIFTNDSWLFLLRKRSIVIVNDKLLQVKEVSLSVELGSVVEIVPRVVSEEYFVFIQGISSKQNEYSVIQCDSGIVQSLFTFDSYGNNNSLIKSGLLEYYKVKSGSNLLCVMVDCNNDSSLGIVVDLGTLSPSLKHPCPTFDLSFALDSICCSFPFLLMSSSSNQSSKLLLYNCLTAKNICSFDADMFLGMFPDSQTFSHHQKLKFHKLNEGQIFLQVGPNSLFKVHLMNVIDYTVTHLMNSVLSNEALLKNEDFIESVLDNAQNVDSSLAYGCLLKLIDLYLSKKWLRVTSSQNRSTVTTPSVLSTSFPAASYDCLFVKLITKANLFFKDYQKLVDIFDSLIAYFHSDQDNRSIYVPVILSLSDYVKECLPESTEKSKIILLLSKTFISVDLREEMSNFVLSVSRITNLSEYFEVFNEQVLQALEANNFIDELLQVYKNYLFNVKDSNEKMKTIEKLISLFLKQNSEGDLGYFLLSYSHLMPYSYKLDLIRNNQVLAAYLFASSSDNQYKFSSKVFNDLYQIGNPAAMNYIMCFQSKIESIDLDTIHQYLESSEQVLLGYSKENETIYLNYKNRVNKDQSFFRFLNESKGEFASYAKFRVFFISLLSNILKLVSTSQIRLEEVKRSEYLILENVIIEESEGNHLSCMNKLIDLGDFVYAEEYAIRNNKVLLLLQLLMAQKKSSSTRVSHLLNNNTFQLDDLLLIMNALPDTWSLESVYPFLKRNLLQLSEEKHLVAIRQNLTRNEYMKTMQGLKSIRQESVYFKKSSLRRIRCFKCGFEVSVEGGFNYDRLQKRVYHVTCYSDQQKSQ